ncbi:MAG: hypothetical protein JW951_04440 [Lentisphaerae bacterium]|nr:hypothetical protein [Lentisphaerota bacterium]
MLLLLGVLASGGCRWADRRAVYRVAAETVRAAVNRPDAVEVAGPGEAAFFINKNAACVELPYTSVAADGRRVEGVYVVWCKRIARRWEFDRAFRK